MDFWEFVVNNNPEGISNIDCKLCDKCYFCNNCFNCNKC